MYTFFFFCCYNTSWRVLNIFIILPVPPFFALTFDSYSGRNQRPEGEGEADHFPPQEESAVLRHLGQVELQLRETVPVASQEACWVRGVHDSHQ